MILKPNPPSSLEDVTALVKKNKVALRGVMGIPEVRKTFAVEKPLRGTKTIIMLFSKKDKK